MNTAREIAVEIVRVLQRAGHIAVFAGGCVRDQILGREPHDYDVATSASPEQVRALFPRTVAVGMAFGVVVVVDREIKTEVATLRSDGRYLDGRRPESVLFVSSLREDAARRDFTINAMFMDPISGEVHDFFGGRDDLKWGIIRSVRNAWDRIREDKLRMMRAIRFAARFGFIIEPEMLDAIRDCAAQITQVSWERIAAELSGILTSANPVFGLDLLMETGLMLHVLPEVAPVWERTRVIVEQLAGLSFEPMLAGLLHNIDQSMLQQGISGGAPSRDDAWANIAESVCWRLKLSRVQRERVTTLIAHETLMHRVPELRVSELVALLEREEIRDLIALQHAIAVYGGFPSHRDFLMGKLRELEGEAIASKRLGAKPLVDGKLLTRLRFRSGPVFREIMDAALAAQREGNFVNEGGAEEWVLAHYDPTTHR